METLNLIRKNSGLLSALEENLSPEEVRRLETLGYIETGISPKGPTWRLTDKGKRMRRNLKSETSFFTRVGDFFFRHILHYCVILD